VIRDWAKITATSRLAIILVIASFLFISPVAALSYTASISGISDPVLKEAMEKASLSLSSSDKNMPSRNALRLRANSDIERINNVAIYNGYFNCVTKPKITGDTVPTVDFEIQLGERFTFGQLTFVWNDQDMVTNDLLQRNENVISLAKGPMLKDTPSFRAGAPATGRAIIAIDTELVKALRSRAFAFTKVLSKEVIADRTSGIVDITIVVQTGPIVRFGSTTIIGDQNVKPIFIIANQEWKQGELYSPKLLEKTENALQRTGLFQSVQVEEAKELVADWSLPITINITENKPRTIGAGVSYTTAYGAGISAEWEHRNMQGKGRKLSFDLELWQKMRTVSATYTVPHFQRADQSLIWLIEHDHQNYLPFTSSAIKGSSLIDRQLTPRTNCVYGLSLERLESTGIIDHKIWYLVKAPLQLRWSNANSPFDPTKGFSINIRLTPSYQFYTPHFSYLIQTTSLAAYRSICEDFMTFAVRAGIGNILGAAEHTIPLPDRFFGGSQNSLRGYKTGSVSPLNGDKKPIGGRSMLTGSFEIRTRTQKGLGWVGFYDIGNVYRNSIPDAERHPLLHSVGLGLRYATPIGPLRLDIAFPLNRRRHTDPFFQLYFSIGQAF
jgi:translocation and assembly module TamA